MGSAVRDATPQDALGIARVQNRTWQAAYAHVLPPDGLASLDDDARAHWWREWLDRPERVAHILVVDGADGVVGFASSGPGAAKPTLGELYAIYVLPEASGSGIGQALMRETLARLRADGFREAILWVLEDNPRTRRFYEAGGWYADGGAREQTLLETSLRVVRYRIALEPSG